MSGSRRAPQRRRSAAPSPLRAPSTSGSAGRDRPKALDAGNRAVVQALRDGRTDVQRDLFGWLGGGAPERVTDVDPQMEQYNQERADQKDFIEHGMYGPEDQVSQTKIGGFEAAYAPIGQILFIVLRAGIDFQPGIEFDGTTATANQPSTAAAASATAINQLPLAQRAAAVAPWQWDPAETEPWQQRFKEQIDSAWSGKHQFRSSRRHWGDLGARVDVDVQVHGDGKDGDDHVGVTSYKVPPAGSGNVGVVKHTETFFHDATDNEMLLNSTDVEPRTDGILTAHFDFDPGASTLQTGMAANVTQSAIRFRRASTCSICHEEVGMGSPITVSVQGADEAAAQSRFDLLKAGFFAADAGGGAASRLRFAYGGPGDGADLDANNGSAQVVAAHEAGHMFGLGDEYAMDDGGGLTGTGADAGETTRSNGVVKDAGFEASRFENGEGIMSAGSIVHPQNYATFLEALKSVTDEDGWELGTPHEVLPPVTGPVDGPLPGQPPPDTLMG